MKDTQETSIPRCNAFNNTGTKTIPCNESLSNFFPQNSVSNLTDLNGNTETYLERSLGFLIVGGIGICSNLVAIYVLGSSPKTRRKLVNTLIIHQSFIDLLACVFLVGMAHLDGTDQHGLEGFHAEVYCFFVANKFPLWGMMNVSSFSLIFINIERYISIVFPIYHHTKVTRKKVIMYLPIVWILGILEVAWVCSCLTTENGTCVFNKPDIYEMTVIAFLVLHFFLPIILVLFLYGHMFTRLKHSSKTRRDSTSKNRNDLMEKAKRNVFKTMLLLTICYAICYVFNSIYITLITRGIFDSFSGE